MHVKCELEHYVTAYRCWHFKCINMSDGGFVIFRNGCRKRKEKLALFRLLIQLY